MSHIQHKRDKLLKRIRRVQGQLKAVENAIANGVDCSDVLQQIAACRGAMNGLMGEVLEDHIRCHVNFKSSTKDTGAEELVSVVRSYLK